MRLTPCHNGGNRHISDGNIFSTWAYFLCKNLFPINRAVRQHFLQACGSGRNDWQAICHVEPVKEVRDFLDPCRRLRQTYVVEVNFGGLFKQTIRRRSDRVKAKFWRCSCANCSGGSVSDS